jgi:hypothetical protein
VSLIHNYLIYIYLPTFYCSIETQRTIIFYDSYQDIYNSNSVFHVEVSEYEYVLHIYHEIILCEHTIIMYIIFSKLLQKHIIYGHTILRAALMKCGNSSRE